MGQSFADAWEEKETIQIGLKLQEYLIRCECIWEGGGCREREDAESQGDCVSYLNKRVSVRMRVRKRQSSADLTSGHMDFRGL